MGQWAWFKRTILGAVQKNKKGEKFGGEKNTQ